MENFGWDIDWLAATPEFQAEVRAFQQEWESEDETLWVQTSGSTGRPKPMEVEKKRMRASARTTLSFVGVKKGDTALLCLPVKYIAGKMMMVRAREGQLQLWVVTPSSHPLAHLSQAPVFAAMTPMQVSHSLQVEKERALLRDIRQLIIGGGAIDRGLQEQLRDFPHAVWSTYGMTETLSHVALRRLSGPEASDWYLPFQGVGVSLSAEGTLCIDAPQVCAQHLITRDLAELRAEGGFRILGRLDNVINSGGVKVQIEPMEEVIRRVVSVPFQITSVPHTLLGEEVVLLCETSSSLSEADWQRVQAVCRTDLPAYWCPRGLRVVDHLPFTETGKPDRATARRLASEAIVLRPA